MLRVGRFVKRYVLGLGHFMRGSIKFCQRVSNLDNVFLFFFSLMRGGRIQIPLLAGHQRHASEPPKMAFRWRADDGPPLNADLAAL